MIKKYEAVLEWTDGGYGDTQYVDIREHVFGDLVKLSELIDEIEPIIAALKDIKVFFERQPNQDIWAYENRQLSMSILKLEKVIE